MVPQIINDLHQAFEPFQATGVSLEPQRVRAMLLMLAYLETEWRNMERRLNGTAGPVLLDPNSNVVSLKQPSPGPKPGGGAA